MTKQQISSPFQPPISPNAGARRRWWSRGAAVVAAALVLVGAGSGVGMALAASGDSSSMTSTPPTTAASPIGKVAGKHKAGRKQKIDPARQAWAQKYGLDRSTMPTLPDVSSASAEQQAAARDLLLKTEAATAQYADLAKAKAAGFDLQAALAKKERKTPRLATALQRIDSGQQKPGAKMPMLHVANDANRADGKVLDPAAPETLMYSYQGHGNWMLVGVMYTANESYPQAPPDPGGPITRWHYHSKPGGQKLMMHIFFVPGNDLAHAYATEMAS